MPYTQVRGRKPFERASKIAHTEIINNPVVQQFVNTCTLPAPPGPSSLDNLLTALPPGRGTIKTIIAIDGGLNETWIREEYPSASVAFITLGPLLLHVADLDALDAEPFIGPEDMQRLKKIQRYSVVIPTRAVRAPGASTFVAGVRRSVQEFLTQGDGHLMDALAWLLFRGWRTADREAWNIPRCPNDRCEQIDLQWEQGQPTERQCPGCGQPIFLADALRLYERIDEEQGAGAILSYLLTTLEQLVLVHLIKSVWRMKPDLMKEILFVKDGPLAFFGVTAPLYKPMRELMEFLRAAKGGPFINLVGLEKSGPFVDHAVLIEDRVPPEHVLVLGSKYIYKYVVPGDPDEKEFGFNTYYGAKAILRTREGATYVATIPTGDYKSEPRLEDLVNGVEVLRTTARLRCSMYDNALIPVVLANRLVSLADVPSSEILKKFARDRLGA
jgi:hypothetical protein